MKDVNSIQSPRNFTISLDGHALAGLAREANKNGLTIEQELSDSIQFIYAKIPQDVIVSRREGRVDSEAEMVDTEEAGGLHVGEEG